MTAPAFGGKTFDPARDGSRLAAQLVAVKAVMADQRWRTLAELAAAVQAPEASVSARLRDLRKPQHGAYQVEREHVRRGLFRYRVLPPRPAQQANLFGEVA